MLDKSVILCCYLAAIFRLPKVPTSLSALMCVYIGKKDLDRKWKTWQRSFMQTKAEKTWMVLCVRLWIQSLCGSRYEICRYMSALEIKYLNCNMELHEPLRQVWKASNIHNCICRASWTARSFLHCHKPRYCCYLLYFLYHCSSYLSLWTIFQLYPPLIHLNGRSLSSREF